eukprot:jgi/Chrzof1/2844/Cz12g00260.t1
MLAAAAVSVGASPLDWWYYLGCYALASCEVLSSSCHDEQAVPLHVAAVAVGVAVAAVVAAIAAAAVVAVVAVVAVAAVVQSEGGLVGWPAKPLQLVAGPAFSSGGVSMCLRVQAYRDVKQPWSSQWLHF